ncbi:hypothetical protein tloyanaT_07760 [Thalassotalea loyana]|uniref:Uncharacterized protein n=1 Tax=Thalassotalea loyana TaxID=280483 RepID=A0ABQ6H993_9GAMM|nr:hypothetical protein [Thalassotalea loyana]GLX84524.1 hypothetical protein tloyanaT_07760 [Thalassotalea loyana]
MDIIQLVLFVIFIVLTTIGYKKNNRNLMLLGAVLVGTGYFGLEFVIGFVESIEGIETSL